MRPPRDQWAMQLALVTATRANCLRRAVGCVLLNAKGHVLATGYNGAAMGLAHCGQAGGCQRIGAASGDGLDRCPAIHAEQNAMLQCHDVHQIETCYVTTSPCITCTKLLLNTDCQRVVFVEAYPHEHARRLWEASGRRWEQLQIICK